MRTLFQSFIAVMFIMIVMGWATQSFGQVGADVTADGVGVRVIYLEPTESADGGSLDDLASTDIYIMDETERSKLDAVFADANGATTDSLVAALANVTLLDSRNVPAIELTGGKRIEEQFSVTVQRGKRLTINALVVATDTSKNVSDPVDVTKMIEKVAPGQVKKAGP